MNNAVRTEVDLLGTHEIPADAYYGIHAQRAIENFQISGVTINQLPAFIRGMVQVKKATALANGELGAVPADVARDIVWACDQVLVKGRCMDQFPVDVFQGGAGTSLNMNTNEVVANLALEHRGLPKGSYEVINPNDHVNRSQSTNDAYPTGLRLGLHEVISELETHVRVLAQALHAKGDEFHEVLKMGRTQLQDAVPMTLGQEFHGWGSTLEEEVSQLVAASDALLVVNLGATAIGTGLNTPDGFTHLAVEKLSEVTGKPCKAAPDLIEATSDCGDYVMVHAALKRLALKLSKVCNDLRLLSSGPRAGLNEINLPEMQAGSSIMPAKVNPVIPEVVNQVCFKVFGNDVAVLMAADAGQLQLNVMEPAIGQAMFESVTLLRSACDTLRDKCVVGITANEQRCRDYVMNSIGIITYLNDLIGHHEGDLIGKEAAATGKGVRELVLQHGLLSEAMLDKVFSTENLMHPVDVTRMDDATGTR